MPTITASQPRSQQTVKRRKGRIKMKKNRQFICDKEKNPRKFWQELKWKEKSKEIGASQAELENHFRTMFSDKTNSENSHWVTYVRHFNEMVSSEQQQNRRISGRRNKQILSP